MASRFLNSNLNLFSPDDECPAGKSGESWADSMNPAITATVVEPKRLFPDKEQASVLVTRAYRPATRHGWQKCPQTEKDMEEAAVAKRHANAEKVKEAHAKALSAAVHVSVNVSGPGGAPQVPESAFGPGAAEVVPAEVAVEPSASSLPVQTKEEKRAAKKAAKEAAKAEKAATKAAEKAAKKAAKAAAKKPAAKPTAKKAAAKQGSNDHDDGKQGGPADTLQDEDTMMEAEVQDDDHQESSTKKRAAPNTKATFAGRRPPKDPFKLQIFNEMKEVYLKTRPDVVPSDAKNNGNKSRVASPGQQAYWTFMSKKMAELGKEGITGQDRMMLATKAWAEKKEELLKNRSPKKRSPKKRSPKKCSPKTAKQPHQQTPEKSVIQPDETKADDSQPRVESQEVKEEDMVTPL